MIEVIINGINYRLNEETKTAEVIEKDGYEGDIIIPETVVLNEAIYRVTGIEDYAFDFCKNLKSITIPDSVNIIGESAFCGCKLLTAITISNSVKSIGYGTFKYCDSLTAITIPHGVMSIGEVVFEDCKNLESITIPDSIESIGREAFYCCKSLKAICYEGTKAQWKKIILANDTFKAWNRRSAIRVIHCTDGNIWIY